MSVKRSNGLLLEEITASKVDYLKKNNIHLYKLNPENDVVMDDWEKMDCYFLYEEIVKIHKEKKLKLSKIDESEEDSLIVKRDRIIIENIEEITDMLSMSFELFALKEKFALFDLPRDNLNRIKYSSLKMEDKTFEKFNLKTSFDYLNKKQHFPSREEQKLLYSALERAYLVYFSFAMLGMKIYLKEQSDTKKRVDNNINYPIELKSEMYHVFEDMFQMKYKKKKSFFQKIKFWH